MVNMVNAGIHHIEQSNNCRHDFFAEVLSCPTIGSL